MKFNENQVENLKRSVEEKVKNAIENSFDLLENEKKYAEGELSLDEFLVMLDNAAVKVATLNEFRWALEMLSNYEGLDYLNKEKIDKIIAHENAHSNKSEMLGANHDYYSIPIFKDNNIYILRHLSTVISNLNDKNYKEDLIKILEAPDEYGEKMSESDIKMRKDIYLKKGESEG